MQRIHLPAFLPAFRSCVDVALEWAEGVGSRAVLWMLIHFVGSSCGG